MKTDTNKNYPRYFARIIVSTTLMLGLTLGSVAPTMAVDTSSSNFLSNYYYNSLISNGDFVDINSMSVNDIQNFLASQNSYLTQVTDNGVSAAQIIYNAAHGVDAAGGTWSGIVIDTSTGTVSPKVILDTLQKEESLVSLTQADYLANPTQYNNRLSHAMGYACPDSGSCNPAYVGFTNQVENGAWQLRYNYEAAGQNAAWWNQYYPGSSCQYYANNTCSFSDFSGIYSVTMTNQATASLYRYTPHVFNGNYNFWKLFINYFGAGSNPAPGAPTGTNDTSSVTASTYSSSFSITASKASTSIVVYNGVTLAGTGTTSWKLNFTPDIAYEKDYKVQYEDGSGNVIATKTITITRRMPGDINGDGHINLLDLSTLGQSYGIGVPDGDWRDLNHDGQVNILDLSILASNWTG